MPASERRIIYTPHLPPSFSTTFELKYSVFQSYLLLDLFFSLSSRSPVLFSTFGDLYIVLSLSCPFFNLILSLLTFFCCLARGSNLTCSIFWSISEISCIFTILLRRVIPVAGVSKVAITATYLVHREILSSDFVLFVMLAGGASTLPSNRVCLVLSAAVSLKIVLIKLPSILINECLFIGTQSLLRVPQFR